MTTPAPSSNPESLRWGFIGAGRMASALARGMIRAGIASADRVAASDPFPAAREQLAREVGVIVHETNALVIEQSDVIVLAVKPQSMSTVLAEIAPMLAPRHLVVSIAAGVSIATMAKTLGESTRLIRVMPNTPALLGEGASAFALGSAATEADAETIHVFLESVGRAARVPESQLDAVTGLSGSGPAFVYMIVEALSDGGVRAGLPRDVATTLAAQTVLGAARMVLETGQHPGTLKDQVTSPGGTTIAGVQILERAGLRGALIDAVDAAARRSAELASAAKGEAGDGNAPTAPSSFHEEVVLARLLADDKGDIPDDLARYLLGLTISDRDRLRMHDLTVRNQDGALSPGEREEMLAFAESSTLLSILKSRARRSLDAKSARSPEE